MICTICGKPIVLVPSAAERAKKFGGKPSDYSNLFREHAECALEKRKRETKEVVDRLAKELKFDEWQPVTDRKAAVRLKLALNHRICVDVDGDQFMAYKLPEK